MTESLRQKQERFSLEVSKLVIRLAEMGVRARYREVLRTPEQAAHNAAAGKGTRSSLHIERLAIDLNLFRGGKFLDLTTHHQPLGEYWESLAPDCRWGGRFGDGNHYSIEHGGRK